MKERILFRLEMTVTLVKRFLVAVLLFGGVGYLAAGSMKLSTIYPAPMGTYTELHTTGKTLLGKGSGAKVGIGTTSIPDGKDLAIYGEVAMSGDVDISGAAKMSWMKMTPRSGPPPDAEDGMIFVGTDGYLHWRSGGNWKKMLSTDEQELDTKELGSDFSLTNDWKNVLKSDEKTFMRGIHLVSWNGRAKIENGAGKKVLVRVRYGNSATIWSEEFENESGGTHYYDFSSSSLIQLKKNVNYNFRLQAKKKNNGNQKILTTDSTGAKTTLAIHTFIPL